MIATTGQALVAVIREGADEVELPVVALQEDDEGYVKGIVLDRGRLVRPENMEGFVGYEAVKVYSQEYVDHLRAEAAKYRMRAKGAA